MISGASFAFVALSLFFMCEGRVPLKNEDYDLDQRPLGTTKVSTEKDGELTDLLNTILEAIEHCKQEGSVELAEEDSIPPCADHLESLAIELSPEKRKVLSEILSLMFNSQEQKSLAHKLPRSTTWKPLIAKDIEMFSLPPGQQINVHELLKFILEPSTTTIVPAEIEHLKKLISGNKNNLLDEDPILQKTIRKFVNDAKQFNRGLHHFA